MICKNKLIGLLISVAFSYGLTACTDSGGTCSLTECSNNNSNPNNVDFDFQGMFVNLADNVIVRNYSEFSAQSKAFHEPEGALTSYCSNIGTPQELQLKSQAQQDWLSMMAQWQQIELHQVGPVATNAVALRARIHSYGSTSGLDTCMVDRNVVRAGDEGFSISQWQYPARGLEAIEYLLFNDDLSFTCTSIEEQTPVWQEMSEQEQRLARCEYMLLTAEDISSAATMITESWSGSEGFRAKFTGIENVSEQLQALSDGLFYLEKTTKDIKLGITTGIKGAGTGTDFCETVACPERVESPFSHSSLKNIRNNLVGFWAIYTGGNGLGFDDLIQAKGLSSVNVGFGNEVQSAIDFIDSMLANDLQLYAQTQAILENNHQSECANSQGSDSLETTYTACALHTKLKLISDRLRTDFITAVNVSLPQSAQSDGD